MSLLVGTVLFSVFAAIVLYWYRNKSSSPSNLPFPPGPKPLPFLGNVLDLPASHEYLTYARWGKLYGDIVHVRALGKHIIIINSVNAANELLDGRSTIYSDRPFIPMLNDPRLMDSNWSFVFRGYSPAWKRQRRLFTRHLSPAASREFFHTLSSSAHTLLRSLLDTPENLAGHLRHTAAEAILEIAYGYKIQPKDDPLVALADRAVKIVLQASLPGQFLVNVFPWLKFVPAWVPGAGFKTFAAKGKEAEQGVVEMTYAHAKRRIDEGAASPSFMTNALTDASPNDLVDIQSVAVTMHGAASDTTVSSIHSCILALVMDPAIQTRAQAELDDVLGPVTSPTFRLPTFSDRPHLPYIEAIVKESLRWLPVTPIGVLHASTENDVYRGWKIPKGSIVIANSWNMLRDEITYPDPLVFSPERFLGEKPQPHPGTRGCFGFGKRECPGRHLAEASVWIQIASLLAVFNFSPAKDVNGKDIDVNYAREPPAGLVVHPKNFPCTITPRSKESENRCRETDPEA